MSLRAASQESQDVDSLSVCSYWGARRETLADCAARVLAFLRDLERCHPKLSTWFGLGRSRRQALKNPVVVNLETITDLLGKGVNRADLDGSVIEDLGYGLRVWNGQPDSSSVGLSIHCGAWSSYVGNSVVVDIGQPETALAGSPLPHALRCILRSAVDAFEPDCGTVMSSELREQVGSRVGWLVHLGTEAHKLPKLPVHQVEEVPGRGVIVTVVENGFSSSDQLTVARVRAVAERLKSSGLGSSLVR